jgi:tetratricopeptide (TPR) repeat protein
MVSLAPLLIVSAAHGQANTTKLPEANSEATSDASKSFWSGKESYESGQFALAQEQFQRAYFLTKDPDLLYDIAQSYRKMGKCALALQSYQDFLRLAPASPLAPQAGKQVSDLQALCSSTHQETTPVELPSDKHNSESPTPVAQVSARNQANLQPSPRLDRDQLGLIKQLRTWTYVTLAAGVAAGGTATVLELWNDHRYHDWSDRNGNLAQGPAPGEKGSEWLARQQKNDQLGNSIQKVDREVIFISLGAGALLATSAVLILATSAQSPKSTAALPLGSEVAFQPVVLGTRLVSLSMLGSF